MLKLYSTSNRLRHSSSGGQILVQPFPAPWELEDELLGRLSLPLNIKGNRDHPFAKALTEARIQAIKDAREWPITIGNNRCQKSVE
jgi:hypothetical protein|tara:strand:- start:2248 stop:2505 length:258 start_codon:yes stop_codon:yes gene_type:complete